MIATMIAATCFGYGNYPSSGCVYQKCKKENYISVALAYIHTVIKY